MAGNGCQTHAGILKPGDGTLTDIAKQKFIKETKEMMKYGSENLPTPPDFPCGPAVQPVEHADLLDLENEERFPEFHQNILKSYERIAQKLDLPSDFKFLPLCDPVALGTKFNVKLRLKFIGEFIPFLSPALPLVALKMKKMPPIELAGKFPDIPAVPPPIPKFDLPPNIEVPDFFTFSDFNIAFSTGIPKFIASLALKTPELALKLVSPPDLFSSICDAAFQSNLFGEIKPESTTLVAATKVLTQKVVEMSFIAAVGTTLGSAPGGLVGGIGRYRGYVPPVDEGEDPAEDPRDLAVEFARTMDGVSYSSDKDKYAQNLFYKEYDDGNEKAKQKTYGYAAKASSCGLFVRACFFNAHAEEAFFVHEYQVGTAISGLYQIAKDKNALIPFTTKHFPSLRRGDAIIVSELSDFSDAHVLLVEEDYSGGFDGPIQGIEGGLPDSGNDNRPTAIESNVYDILRVIDGRVKTGKSQGIASPPRTIIALIDCDKVVKKIEA
jgi:hypothetical protein